MQKTDAITNTVYQQKGGVSRKEAGETGETGGKCTKIHIKGFTWGGKSYTIKEDERHEHGWQKWKEA